MAQIVRQGAELVGNLHLPRPVRQQGWEPAFRMTAAASRLSEAYAGLVQALLVESARRLEPLGDPLATDFGLHRWLAGDREEAYSDWLQWILQQVRIPNDVFRLLHVEPPGELRDWPGTAPSVGREFPVPQGAEGRTGRLDLWVRYEGLALFVLEVKKADTEHADTAKQAGYKRWLDDQPEPHQFAILVAAEASEDLYQGFRFLSWAHLCLRMRHLARCLCGEGRHVVAAMTLAFVGAVEQNLLGFSMPASASRRSAAVNPRLVAHLEQWLLEED
jgi:hypothetical protein